MIYVNIKSLLKSCWVKKKKETQTLLMILLHLLRMVFSNLHILINKNLIPLIILHYNLPSNWPENNKLKEWLMLILEIIQNKTLQAKQRNREIVLMSIRALSPKLTLSFSKLQIIINLRIKGIQWMKLALKHNNKLLILYFNPKSNLRELRKLASQDKRTKSIWSLI